MFRSEKDSFMMKRSNKPALSFCFYLFLEVPFFLCYFTGSIYDAITARNEASDVLAI